MLIELASDSLSAGKNIGPLFLETSIEKCFHLFLRTLYRRLDDVRALRCLIFPDELPNSDAAVRRPDGKIPVSAGSYVCVCISFEAVTV